MSNNEKTIKQEGGESSSRIQLLEDQTKALTQDVTKFLSIITIQTEQLARQERILSDLRDARNKKATGRLMIGWIILIVMAILIFGAIYMGYPSVLLRDDTPLYLNVKATPVKAPFITAGVKVRFTMGDLVSCVKGAFSGDTIDLSLS